MHTHFVTLEFTCTNINFINFRKLVLEIANARRHYFKILRPRKESMESFVATFMDTNILPLWPTGCVRLQTLLKYASPVEPV